MTKLFTTATFKPGTEKHGEPVLHIEGYNGSYQIPQQLLVELLIEDGQMCEDCYDEGEVSTDESDGEGHIMRGVGTRKCHCKNRDEDDRDDL